MCRGKLRARASIHVARARAILSRIVKALRVSENRGCGARAFRAERQAFESSAFEAMLERVMTAATHAKKNFAAKRADARIEVAGVTMMLRYCHTCGFRARFLSLAFHFPAWLKGFLDVARPSQANAFPVTLAPRMHLRAPSTRSLLNQFDFWAIGK